MKKVDMKIARLTSLCLTLLLMCVVSYPVFADYNTTVPTPKKSSVSVTAREWELSADVITKADAEIATLFPKAKKVRSASRKYNCHSYAWYSTASTNYYWMSDPSKYITDGSYVQKYEPVASRKITYGYTTYKHSGILISISTVRSKWGEYGLYEHAITYVPEIYEPRNVKYFAP